jgi:hypothetical protein
MLKLIRTCTACPEQYDVYDDVRQVGYLRLRHGVFYADYFPPNSGERIGVYEASPQGDGIFAPEERVHYLNYACRAIQQAIASGMTKLQDGKYENEPVYQLLKDHP